MAVLESFIVWVAVGVLIMLTVIKFYYKEWGDWIVLILYIILFICSLYFDSIKYWYC